MLKQTRHSMEHSANTHIYPFKFRNKRVALLDVTHINVYARKENQHSYEN